MPNFRKALIVDDDTTCRFLLKMHLKKVIQTAKVVDLADGQQAFNYLIAHCTDAEVAQEECPDLILLDLNMPVMDGFEFLALLHSIRQTKPIRVKVVVVTSSDNPKDIDLAHQYNIDGYLLKPITEESLSDHLSH